LPDVKEKDWHSAQMERTGGFGDDRQGIAALPEIPHPIGFGRADKLNTFNQQKLV
jgi:hypothetical protein